MERSIDDVEAYVAATSKLESARKSSLFFKANINHVVSDDRALYRADPSDLLGFCPRTDEERSIGRGLITPIMQGSTHELQIHIHHENYTYNDTARNPETFAYLQSPRARRFDNARLELAVRLSLDLMAEDGGPLLKRWFFIHGHWALNASDPHECTIVREIEILSRNGCLGDFTQPAGRAHVDSRIDVPYLVDPVAAAKGYDSVEARPVPASGAGAGAGERFFIWASATNHELCSIDTYSAFVQRRLRTPELTALEHAANGVISDGTLFVKTHCHSLHPIYWKEGGRPLPQSDPGVRAELGILFDAADAIGAPISFLRVSEVYDRIVGAPAHSDSDLVAASGLRLGSPMQVFGHTVEFRTSDGKIAAPPPLDPRPTELPLPICAEPAAERALDVAVAYVTSLVPPTLLDGIGGAVPAALVDARRQLSDLMAAVDVETINRVSSRVAAERLAQMDAEAAGITGFYGLRAREGTLLQPSEVLCAAVLSNHMTGVRGAVEIGCGLGVLSILLASRGVDIVGLERNRARLNSAQAIAAAVRVELGPVGRRPKLARGAFPKALRRAPDLSQHVALVTNLLGSATEEQENAFIAGLTRFGAVLIDPTRFYRRRTTSTEIAELLSRFAATGFGPPRPAFDLGADGRFMLLLNPTPTRLPGLQGLFGRMFSPRARLGLTLPR